ncbi:hypothetical protein Trydic_g1228 [Trypoxylus dichotomus]
MLVRIVFLLLCCSIIFTRSDAVVKPGRCPPSDPDIVTICLVTCNDDSDCTGINKCCTVGCLRSCRNPVPFWHFPG